MVFAFLLKVITIVVAVILNCVAAELYIMFGCYGEKQYSKNFEQGPLNFNLILTYFTYKNFKTIFNLNLTYFSCKILKQQNGPFKLPFAITSMIEQGAF